MNNELTIEQYGELCMAHARGETTICTSIEGCDFYVLKDGCIPTYKDAKQYNWRINPKTVKLYLWALIYDGYPWNITPYFYASEQDVKASYTSATAFKRLDWSMIEVEQ